MWLTLLERKRLLNAKLKWKKKYHKMLEHENPDTQIIEEEQNDPMMSKKLNFYKEVIDIK